MARKKKKKNSGPFLGIPLFPGKKAKRRTRAQRDADTAKRKMTIGISVSIMLCTAAAVGFVMLDKYIKNVSPVASATGSLHLLNTPAWYNDHLDTVIASAVGGTEFNITADMAKAIAENLELLPWLYNVQVMTKKDRIEVAADFRKPIAMLEMGNRKYYLAATPVAGSNDVVVHVLNYIPIGKLPIVNIEGISAREIPLAGSQWNAEDVAAAVDLLVIFSRMDARSTPEKPLLAELAAIDVTNYNARKYRSSSSRPHIILYAHDGTEIYWGAAIGQSARYFEASETEKLGQLYSKYKEYGTLQCKSNNKVKYLELRVPQKQIPRP